MSKLKTLLLLCFVSLMVTGCDIHPVGGPTGGSNCIPSDNKGNTTQLTGNGAATAEQIDQFIHDHKIITTVVTQLKTSLIGDSSNFSESRGIFQAFLDNTGYHTAIMAAFTLFVIIYGVAIITGMVQVSLTEATIKTMQLALVAALALDWDMFYNHIGYFFMAGTDEIMNYFLQNFNSLYTPGGGGNSFGAGAFSSVATDSNSIFTGLDNFIADVFSLQTFAFVSALMHSGQYAPIYGVFLMISLWYVLQAIMQVVTVYVFSLFGKALLFAVAPIFLVFLLFGKTRDMFMSWVRQLVSFSLQPIMVCAFLGLFINLLTPFFQEFTQYKLCWNKLNSTGDQMGWTFVDPNSQSDQPIAFGSNSQSPISLQTIALFMFFSWAFISAMKLAQNIATVLAQSSATNLADISVLRQFSNSNSPLESGRGLLKKGT